MRILIFSLVILLSVSACEEVGPTINIIPPERKVLVEEFTGVQCVNCPEGSEKLETLLDQHGENLIVVSIHSGFFSVPHATSAIDFRTPEADALDGFIGPVTFYPSASINRKLFDGENSRLVNLAKWAGLIQQELAEVSPVEMELNTTYDASTRNLEVSTSLNFFEDINQPVHISVLVTETDVVDSQLDLDGLQTDYVHKHVMRDMLTNFDGQLITNATIANSPVVNNFSITLPNEWDELNCAVVAYVHFVSPQFDVLQAEEVKILQ
ncbi:MAG: Omp28-related outer membrane protein [Bacteroidota bacterium]